MDSQNETTVTMLKKIFLTLHRDFDLRVTDFVLAKADFFLSADRDALLNTAAWGKRLPERNFAKATRKTGPDSGRNADKFIEETS
jgi:hypothetical protein